MRTATTIGLTHKGAWKLLAGPDVPLLEQLKGFRSILGAKSHPEFAVIQYQETDGHARIFRMRSPKDQAAFEKNRAAQQAAAEAAGKAELEGTASTDAKEVESPQEELAPESTPAS